MKTNKRKIKGTMKTRNKRRESDRYEKLLRNPSLC